MAIYSDIGVRTGDVLLPKAATDLYRWAVIACDQFTSEPEYWEKVAGIVGGAASTYNLILPEVHLGSSNEATHIQRTQQTMRNYLDQGLFRRQNSLILVERSVLGKTRYGLMLALDLEHYDFNKGSQTLIRATEGTILDRLPPRMRIREGALLELPHILVLIDDPQGTVIEPLVAKKGELSMLYDTDLMLGSGHITGRAVNTEADEARVIAALRALADPAHFRSRYGVGEDKGVLLFAMGDGNHSLATAKAIWEQNKARVGMDHPSRYALVEIENVHDQGLEFEPIHRVVFNTHQPVLTALQAHFGDAMRFDVLSSSTEMIERVNRGSEGEQHIGIVSAEQCGVLSLTRSTSNLPVGSIQAFLDAWLKDGGAEKIDYVHGSEVVTRLGSQPGNVGFFLPAMQKSELFKTVILDGALPRKTFSMGEAVEKRFYLEARRIA